MVVEKASYKRADMFYLFISTYNLLENQKKVMNLCLLRREKGEVKLLPGASFERGWGAVAPPPSQGKRKKIKRQKEKKKKKKRKKEEGNYE